MNNLCLFIGRLYKDLELKYTKDKKAVLDLPLAISNGKDDTTFLNISVFGTSAENTAKYCKKGDLVAVKCSVKNHNWEDNKGNKHYDYNFICSSVTFVAKKNKDDAKDNTTDKTKEEKPSVEITDADLPF